MNCIRELEINIDAFALSETAEEDASEWLRRYFLPVLETVLEDEWARVVTTINHNSCVDTIKIHHIRLEIVVQSLEEFLQKFCEDFVSELRAALGYVLSLRSYISDNSDNDSVSSGSRHTGSTARMNKIDNSDYDDKSIHSNLDESKNLDKRHSSFNYSYPFQQAFDALFLSRNKTAFDFSKTLFITRHWRNWCKTYGPQLRSATIQHLQFIENRKMVAELFSAELQDQLITLIEPVNAAFIFQYITAVDSIDKVRSSKSLDESGSNQNITVKTDIEIDRKTSCENSKNYSLTTTEKTDRLNSADGAVNSVCDYQSIQLSRRYMVEFTLAYLCCERGSRFNRKMYMRSVVRQVAAHNNLRPDDLNHILAVAVKNTDFSGVFANELLEIFLQDSSIKTPSFNTTHGRAQRYGLTHEYGFEKSEGKPVDIRLYSAIRSISTWLRASGADAHDAQQLISSFELVLSLKSSALVTLFTEVLKSQSYSQLYKRLRLLPEHLRFDIGCRIAANVYLQVEPYLETCRTLFSACFDGRLRLSTVEVDRMDASDSNRDLFMNLFLEFCVFHGQQSSHLQLQKFLSFCNKKVADKMRISTKESYKLIYEKLRRLKASANTQRYLLWDIDAHLIYLCPELRGRFQPGSGKKYSQTANTFDETRVIYDQLAEINHGLEFKDDQLNIKFRPLILAVQNGRWNISDSLWRDIYTSNRSYLRSVTILLIQNPKYRRLLVSKVPLSIQRQLLEILEPELCSSVSGVWDSADTIKQLFTGRIVRDNGRDSSMDSVIREFTFEYMAHERGSEFNQRSYARSILRQLSFHFNVDYQKVLNTLRDYLSASSIPEILKKNWLAIVGIESADYIKPENYTSSKKIETTSAAIGSETKYRKVEKLSDEQDLDYRVSQSRNSSINETELDNDSVHREINQSNASGVEPFIKLVDLIFKNEQRLSTYENSHIKTLIRYLAKQQPLYMLRLIDLLRDKENRRRLYGRNIDFETHLCLLKHILPATGYAKNGVSLFEQSVLSYAKRSTNKEQFIAEVINAVLSGSLIDMEACLNASSKTSTDLRDDGAEHKSTEDKGAENKGRSATLDSKTFTPDALDADFNEAFNYKHLSTDEWLSDITSNNTQNTTFNRDTQAIIAECSESLAIAQEYALIGERELTQRLYAHSSSKVKILHDYSQVLRLLLKNCERRLLANEPEWSGLLKSENRLHERQWLAIMLHCISEQLVKLHQVSTDRFVQRVLMEVIKLWKLDKSRFSMKGFARICLHQLYTGQYFTDTRSSSHQNHPFSKDLKNIFESLSAVDIGMDIKHVDAVDLTPNINTNFDHRYRATDRLTRSQGHGLHNDKTQQKILYAGIVVLAPYITMLFERAGLLASGHKKIVEPGKAIQLLYYLVSGNLCPMDTITPENQFSEWGLLCILSGVGMDTAIDIPRLVDDECRQCDQLLAAVIQHWKALGSTSLDGLRQTFLQRAGDIQLNKDKGWILSVENHALDVLLDRLPWRFSVIKFPYMENAVHVEWRK